MNFPFYISKRYLFSKKSHNAINIISGISAAGVAIGTLALVVILSAFNGIEGLVASLYNSFDADVEITVIEGKTFSINAVDEETIKSWPGVRYAGPVIEESTLLSYGNQQSIARLKGITTEHLRQSGLDSMITSGANHIAGPVFKYAILGMGLRYVLNLPMREDMAEPVKFYVPMRGKSYVKDKESAFNTEYIGGAAEFSINADLDTRYTIVPFEFAQELLKYGDQVSSYEILLDDKVDPETVKAKVVAMMGDGYKIKTRREQNELLYKTSKTEKWFTFLVLTFILVIATFNIIASLTMLVIDKSRDINILASMGCTPRTMRLVFFFQGMLINVSGCVIGLGLGLLLVFLQKQVGLIPLDGTIVDYYPVQTKIADIALILFTVLTIGFLATWFPVRYLMRRHARATIGLVK